MVVSRLWPSTGLERRIPVIFSGTFGIERGISGRRARTSFSAGIGPLLVSREKQDDFVGASEVLS